MNCFKCGQAVSDLVASGKSGYYFLKNEIICDDCHFVTDLGRFGGSVKTHELKILPKYFRQVVAGNKTFELRKNDRGFKLHDKIKLKEVNTETWKFTGSYVEAVITYLLEKAPEYGLEKGSCIFSFRITSKNILDYEVSN